MAQTACATEDELPHWPEQPLVMTCDCGDAPRWREPFARAHLAALRRHGVPVDRLSGAATLPPAESHMVLALQAGVVVGGLLLYDAAAGPLPLERTVGEVVPRDLRAGTGELGAVFVDEAQRGTGLSRTLVSTAVTLAPLLDLRRVFLFSHQFSAPLYRAFGWRDDPRFPEVIYPAPPYRSRVMTLPEHLLSPTPPRPQRRRPTPTGPHLTLG